MKPVQRLEAAIRTPKGARAVAIMPYVVSGYPEKGGFSASLAALSVVADAIEVGVPFSDPMADGLTIAAASQVALAQGVSLRWILDTLAETELSCPIVLMSYLNPLLSYGFEALAARAAEVGVCAFIVPDLPLHESAGLRAAAQAHGLGLISLVTPVTGAERLASLCAASEGFVYAVTVTGVTGSAYAPSELMAYLERVRAASGVPVCAGFGIGDAAQVAALAGHADGAIVGSALVKAMGAGVDAAGFVRGLVGA